MSRLESSVPVRNESCGLGFNSSGCVMITLVGLVDLLGSKTGVTTWGPLGVKGATGGVSILAEYLIFDFSTEDRVGFLRGILRIS